MWHIPRSALLYVIMPSMQRRKIAPSQKQMWAWKFNTTIWLVMKRGFHLFHSFLFILEKVFNFCYVLYNFVSVLENVKEKKREMKLSSNDGISSSFSFYWSYTSIKWRSNIDKRWRRKKSLRFCKVQSQFYFKKLMFKDPTAKIAMFSSMSHSSSSCWEPAENRKSKELI